MKKSKMFSQSIPFQNLEPYKLLSTLFFLICCHSQMKAASCSSLIYDLVHGKQGVQSPFFLFQKYSLTDFSLLFDEGEKVIADDLRGKKFFGEVLKVKFAPLGPRILVSNVGFLADILKFRLPQRNNYFEMHFSPHRNNNISGINYWPARGEILPFKIDENDNGLFIDYNIKENFPIFQKPFLDEIVKLPMSSNYLGKFYYRILGKKIFYFWFMLKEIP